MLAPWQNPKPTTFAVSGGVLIVPDAIEYAVDDAAGVELQAFAAATAIAGLVGYYEATGYSNAGAAGRRTIRWRMRETPTSAWVQWAQSWDTYRGAAANPVPVYALVSDLRDEGVTPAQMNDARARVLLTAASIEVTRFTSRIFGARPMTIMADGRGGTILQLEEPIVAVSELVIGAESSTSVEQAIEPSRYRVYNRHVMGMLMPDDRENPKLEMRAPFGRKPYVQRAATFLDRTSFVVGQQNIRVVGVFGYTDFDGSPAGGVPELIKSVTLMIAARMSAKLGDPSTGVVDPNAWRIVEERTRDQSVRYADIAASNAGSGSAMRGAYTGDPTIDTILAMYARGPRMSAA